MDGNMVLAGIVTYNPSIERLKCCIEAVVEQVDNIIIFDNGSCDVEKIEKLISQYKNNVYLYKNNINAGIATALVRIMNYAYENYYEWVLTLDQDSVLQPGTISAYLEGSKLYQDAGMFTCLIKDRNFVDEKYEKQNEAYKEVEYCITSAAFINVTAYKMTPGYDEDFFIDCVDFDICYSLRSSGYKIYRVNHVGLLHEVGKGENRRFLWKKIVVYHENPLRIYYMARNLRKMHKKHKGYTWLILLKKEAALLLRIILYEDNKKNKFKNFCHGILEA